jgi:hypothetical protein
MPRSLFVPDAVLDRRPRCPSPDKLLLRAAGVVMVGMLASALASCTTTATVDRAPAPTSTQTPIPTSTPSPTPPLTSTPLPTRPVAMDAVTADGAIAAVTYFLDMVPYALSSGDVTQLKELSHPECIFCRSITDDAAQMHTNGQHQEGTAMRVLSARGSEVNPGYWFSVDARVEQGSWQILDAGGNIIQSEPAAKTFAMNFAVIHQDGRWIVRESQNTRE